MFSITPSTISGTGCGTRKIQGSLSAGIATGESAICKVLDSTATSIIAVAGGVAVEPRIASTLSSETNLRAFLTAAAGSPPSSMMMYFTGTPASVFGRISSRSL